MVEIEIDIVRTETIKPSSPTPDHLKRFGLSVFDQYMPDTYTPLLLFYSGGGGVGGGVPDRLRGLKASLSDALARFYPAAGRVVKEELCVDCDDGGVDFVETKVNGCGLSDILGCPDVKVLRKLLPCFSGEQSGARRALLVRANVFECGGLAVGLGFWHALMDACAMSAFLGGWAAAAARGRSEVSPGPDLGGIASRFPAGPCAAAPSISVKSGAAACSTRRFVFRGPEIAALRDRAAIEGGEKPTRVSVALALTWKCIVNALTEKPDHEARLSIVALSTNLRERVEPPVSENSIGNMAIPIFIESYDQNELPILAARFKRVLKDATQNYVTRLQDSEEAKRTVHEVIKKFVTLRSRDDIDFYTFTSWCGFRWYEADFGWGRPVWVSLVCSGVKNVVGMLDASDGDGIEIWVTLPEQDMAFLETNPEFLEFASLNLSV